MVGQQSNQIGAVSFGIIFEEMSKKYFEVELPAANLNRERNRDQVAGCYPPTSFDDRTRSSNSREGF